MDLNAREIKSHPAAIHLYAERLDLTRSGDEYWAICPFHEDKNPSFHISQKDGWLFHCFGCQAAGNVIQFVQKMDKISFQQALKKVEAAVGGSWQARAERVDATFEPASKTEMKPFNVPTESWKQFEDWLANNEAAKQWLQKERGISYETAKRLHFGFIQDVGSIAGPKNQDIRAGGWLAFPYFRKGKLCGIKFRSIQRKAFCQQVGSEPWLFNADAVSELDRVYVVEGELDVAVLAQADYCVVGLSTASAKVGPEMRDVLMRAESRVLAGDGDGPGKQAMDRLANDFKDRTYRLAWPLKDANDTLLKQSKGDTAAFKKVVKNLTDEAISSPIESFYSLPEMLRTSQLTNQMDDPNRFHFPWRPVDRMAVILPGAVAVIIATNTGMGKTAFTTQATIYSAEKHGEVVINYQVELGKKEFANLVSAQVLMKDRLTLSDSDYEEASRRLAGIQYYMGYNESLGTVEEVLDLIEDAIPRLGATVVVIDHFHALASKDSNEIRGQAAAMQRIKRIALGRGVKFILLGQPRKANQQTKGKRVHLTDAKGSESFMSAADCAFAIHRELRNQDPNNPQRDPYEDKTEVQLLKGRSMGDGASLCSLIFKGSQASFYEEFIGEP